jgi:hypothetical protein
MEKKSKNIFFAFFSRNSNIFFRTLDISFFHTVPFIPSRRSSYLSLSPFVLKEPRRIFLQTLKMADLV